MSKIDKYTDMMKSMVDDYGCFRDSWTPDMSDMKNWLCVHVTKYMPRRNKDGQLYIPTTAMATGNKYSRASIHFTINQTVASHMGGNWDTYPIVVLAPYNGIVEKNGNPQQVASEDTFFIPNPDTGLILPENSRVIRPNNNTLLAIGDEISTYKIDKFTEEEIKLILSLIGPWKCEDYEKYNNADFDEYEMKAILQNERVRKIYNTIKNKHDFLCGMFTESKMEILTNFMRELVVRKTMEEMGYVHVFSHEDKISSIIAQAARNKGLIGDSGNKGHSCTLEYEFELRGCRYLTYVDLLKTNNIETIYNKCRDDYPRFKEMIDLFLSDKPLDVYQSYKEQLYDYINLIRSRVHHEQERAKMYPEYNIDMADLRKQWEYADTLKKHGIRAYNSRLQVVLYRNSCRLNQEYAKAVEKLKQNPKFSLLKTMLEDLIRGKKWYKTPMGWKREANIPADIKNIHAFMVKDFRERENGN